MLPAPSSMAKPLRFGFWRFPVGNLTRAGGWTRNPIKAVDKVSVDFWPLRNGSKGSYLKKVTLTDTGKFYTEDIRVQESPNLEDREQK